MIGIDRALRIDRQSAVAFVGAGGKTSALAAVSRAQRPCVATATTHLGDWQTGFADRCAVWPGPVDAPMAALSRNNGVVLVTGRRDPHSHRLRGLSLQDVRALGRVARERGWPLFVEADGARQRPLKAPAAYEPPIPPDSNVVVVVAGLSGLGRPIDEQHVHRPERFAALAGCPIGTAVTADLLARVLVHPDGGLKNVPGDARRLVLLSQADTPDLQAQGERVARAVCHAFDGVVLVSFHHGVVRPL